MVHIVNLVRFKFFKITACLRTNILKIIKMISKMFTIVDNTP